MRGEYGDHCSHIGDCNYYKALLCWDNVCNCALAHSYDHGLGKCVIPAFEKLKRNFEKIAETLYPKNEDVAPATTESPHEELNNTGATKEEEDEMRGMLLFGVALSLLIIAVLICLIHKRLKKRRNRIPPPEDNFSEDETPSLDWENNFSPPLTAYHKHGISDSYRLQQRGMKIDGTPSPNAPSAPPMMVATNKGLRAPTPGSDDPPPSYDEVFGNQEC